MAEQSISAPTDLTQGDQQTDSVCVTVRYFAAARAAAGVQEERLIVSTAVPGQHLGTVGSVLDAAVQLHGPGLDRVLQRCSYLLDEVAVHGRQTQVRDRQVLDVLPPFAGG